MSQLQPLALMSGELQITPLLQGALVTNGHTLVLLGLLKLGLCALCLSSGWIGGQFFPLIFGASAIGMGLGRALATSGARASCGQQPHRRHSKRRAGPSPAAASDHGCCAEGACPCGGPDRQRHGARGAPDHKFQKTRLESGAILQLAMLEPSLALFSYWWALPCGWWLTPTTTTAVAASGSPSWFRFPSVSSTGAEAVPTESLKAWGRFDPRLF